MKTRFARCDHGALLEEDCDDCRAPTKPVAEPVAAEAQRCVDCNHSMTEYSGYACNVCRHHCKSWAVPEAGGQPELLPWIEAQIEGIQRSSIVEASRGALNAFLAVKKKLLTTRVSQPAGEPGDVQQVIDDLDEAAKHFGTWDDDSPDLDYRRLRTSIEKASALLVAQPSPATVPAFKSSKEAMLYAQRNNIPTAIPVSVATPSTPADEEVAREIALRCPETSRSWVIRRITTALAEARRAGTPTTDARREQAKAIVREWLSDKTVNMLTRFTTDDNFVTEPLINAIASAISSTPSDEVAQQARACVKCGHRGGRPDSGVCQVWDYYGNTDDPKDLDRRCECLCVFPLEVTRANALIEDAAKVTERRIEQLANNGISEGNWHELEAIPNLIRALKFNLTATDVERTCTWTREPNPDIEMWETDCGNTFQFEADGPTENKMKFCCYCGKRLAEKVAEEREEGEGDG